MSGGPTGPIGSVVMPAWNEADVIGPNVRSLFDRRVHDPAEGPTVVVACNGCTDGTADVVRSLGLPVTVLDLPPIGKARAIREAEAVAPTLPRVYVDADVRLDGPALESVLGALRSGAVAARPPAEYDTAGASWPVRAYYRVRADLPGIANDLCGAGIYGLSETARSRFGEFPDVRGDDLFVARIVDPDEVVIVDAPPVRVQVPRTVDALTRTLDRVYRGNRELAESHPELSSGTTRATLGDLKVLARRPSRWFDIGVYVALVVVGRIRSRRSSSGWARDDTGRSAAAAPDAVPSSPDDSAGPNGAVEGDGGRETGS